MSMCKCRYSLPTVCRAWCRRSCAVSPLSVPRSCRALAFVTSLSCQTSPIVGGCRSVRRCLILSFPFSDPSRAWKRRLPPFCLVRSASAPAPAGPSPPPARGQQRALRGSRRPRRGPRCCSGAGSDPAGTGRGTGTGPGCSRTSRPALERRACPRA